jgi:hypothetical protein
MRQIRTMCQFLWAHFQRGLTSIDNRLRNSLKRSITPPAGKGLCEISYGVIYGRDLAARIVQQYNCCLFMSFGRKTSIPRSPLGSDSDARVALLKPRCFSHEPKFIHLSSGKIRTAPEQTPVSKIRRSSDACIRRCLLDHPLDQQLRPGLRPLSVVVFRFAL